MISNSTLVNSCRQEDALTYNGAITNSTSLSAIVDLFFIAGASRRMSEKDVIKMFDAALAENTLLTIKLLFWARDIRGGAGERRFFRICYNYLSLSYKDIFNKIMNYIPEYGRWDDLWSVSIYDKEMFSLIKKGLDDKNGLLAKWLPRQRKNNSLFYNKLLRFLELNSKDYRKLIVGLSKTVEQQICSKNWEDVEYSKVPSQSMNKYRTAFYKHDATRFQLFIDSAIKGEVKINSSAIFPYQLYQAIMKGENEKAVQAQWNSLPNYMEDCKERILPMCDVSGSMTGLPMDISISLGIYISERNEGIFKNAFITFTSDPTMQYLNGTLIQRIKQLKGPVGYNTNFTKAFDMILSKALQNNLTQEEMPTMILAISDMEFDNASISGKSVTAMDAIKIKYENAGYKMPKLVFWNVNGRIGNVPVNSNYKNVALVSGASPSIVKSVLAGKDFTPTGIMLETLNSKRYENIVL